MSGDWLALEAPGESDDSWLESEEIASGELPTKKELATLTPRVTSVMLPADIAKRNELIASAWQRLTDKQRTFLHAMPAHRFNIRAAVRALQNTSDRVSRSTVVTWFRKSDDFDLVFKIMRSVAREAAIDPDRLHLMVDEIAELALEGEEVLYQGVPTGYRTKNLASALKAIELQMKATNMLRGEDSETRVKVSIVRMTGDWETADAIDTDAVEVETR